MQDNFPGLDFNMLIVFKARSCTDVIMLGADGQQILRLLGKDPAAPKGIVTVEQLPAAIASLRVASTRQRQAAPDAPPAEGHDDDAEARDIPVQLHQRAQPVLLLLSRALKCEVPVTWGV